MGRGRRGTWWALALFGLGSAGCGEAKKANAIDLGEAVEPAPATPSAVSRDGAKDSAGSAGAGSGAAFNPRLLRRFQPVRAVLAKEGKEPSEAQIELGRALYFEKRLSKTGTLSCNSCHPLDRYGADGEVTSPGHDGTRGGRNSPTTYHAAGMFVQFWDGRAPDVEAQAKGPILNPVEMGMKDAKQVEKVLAGISGYKERFAAAFPGEANALTYDNVGKAIGAFERKLVTPSRWDAYLKGDKNALNAAEVEGLRIFTNVGCMVCHTGEFVGGSIYAKAGVVEPWDNQKDQGRYEVTKAESDRMMFKVPSLRNIAMTAPYFHDGSASTLDAAVRKMGKHQLGLELSESEVKSIVTWLGSLTGELPKAYIAEPKPVDAAG